MFEGSLNQKPIPGFTVNLTVIPDPNKPVSLSVEYNTAAVFPAGGRFPGLPPIQIFMELLFPCMQKYMIIYVCVCVQCSL